MKDLIERQAAIDEITEYGDSAIVYISVGEIKRRLEQLPSAQHEITEEEVKEYCHKRCLCIVDSALLKKYASAQPEIIRCKDCKYWESDYGYCSEQGAEDLKPDDYCSYAERREG